VKMASLFCTSNKHIAVIPVCYKRRKVVSTQEYNLFLNITISKNGS